ncbi:MAG: class I SAM-dependent methyltransferase [Planctomycetota bacterium]|nr:MAG: class I SAM-dependent methyltransferase [Planctomycetota bacterium]
MDKHILDRYNSPEGALSYTKKFRRHWNEYLNNFTEQRLLRKLLGKLPSAVAGQILDCPCGYGRLYPLLREVAEEVIEADYSEHLLSKAREFQARGPFGPAKDYIRADALNLPFEDDRFELVLSVRLCHHIRLLEERLQYVRELMRVSSRYVIFTYFDFYSLKNRLRQLRRKFSPKKREKWTLKLEQVQELAREAGFFVRYSIPLSRFFSGHRYVLLEKE